MFLSISTGETMTESISALVQHIAENVKGASSLEQILVAIGAAVLAAAVPLFQKSKLVAIIAIAVGLVLIIAPFLQPPPPPAPPPPLPVRIEWTEMVPRLANFQVIGDIKSGEHKTLDATGWWSPRLGNSCLQAPNYMKVRIYHPDTGKTDTDKVYMGPMAIEGPVRVSVGIRECVEGGQCDDNDICKEAAHQNDQLKVTLR
jgi:hypothetical protein